VIGGTAQHFLGEYMAGGVLIVLGLQLEADERHPSRYVGTGMHGGVIYVRGRVDERFLGKEVGLVPLDSEDKALLENYVGEYAEHFGMDVKQLMAGSFIKLVPKTRRPYGRLYAY
jgi:glutamate synthase domain-containing protein 3